MGEDIKFRNLSESTYRNYTRNVRKFFAFCQSPWRNWMKTTCVVFCVT